MKIITCALIVMIAFLGVVVTEGNAIKTQDSLKKVDSIAIAKDIKVAEPVLNALPEPAPLISDGIAVAASIGGTGLLASVIAWFQMRKLKRKHAAEIAALNPQTK